MQAARLILRFRLRSLGRAAARHAFAVFGMAPLIVLGFYFVLAPTLARFSGWLQLAAAGWSGAELWTAALALTLALSAGGLPAALRETYAVRTPDAYLDALPLSSFARFNVAALSQFVRNLPVWLACWAGLRLLAQARDPGAEAPLPAGTTALVFAELALIQLAGVLALVRLRLFRPARLLAVGLVLLVLAWAAQHEPFWSLGLGPLAVPAAFWRDALGAALGVPRAPGGVFGGAAAQIGSAVVLYLLAWLAYRAWRDDDREEAARALFRRRRSSRLARRAVEKAFGRTIAALTLRDLRLTGRGFLPATTLAVAAALLFETAGAGAILLGVPEQPWLDSLVLFAGALSCLALAALAPLLLERQIPQMWIEHGSGVRPDALWKAKNRFACLVASPAFATTLALGWWIKGEPVEWAYFAFKALLIWLSVATMIGSLAFAIARSPVVGLLLSGLISMGVAAFYLLADFWPLGLLFYAYLMHYIVEYASAQAAALGGEAGGAA